LFVLRFMTGNFLQNYNRIRPQTMMPVIFGNCLTHSD